MATSSGEHRALLFTAGVRMALRLPMVREILLVPELASEVDVRGRPVPAVPLSIALGLDAPPGQYAILTEAVPPVALRVSEVLGIVDLSRAEAFQLPARTLLPQPPPFQGALVLDGEIALELALAAAGWVPLEPAEGGWGVPPEGETYSARELVFTRGSRRFGLPLALVTRVIEAPRVFPVPLAPLAHRGLLYHERAIHPVFDLAVLYDGAPAAGAALALIVDAGGTTAAILADRIAPAEDAGEVLRPTWDAMFPA